MRITGRIDTTSCGSNAFGNAMAAGTGQAIKSPSGWTLGIVLTPWRAGDGPVEGGKLAFEIDCTNRAECDTLANAYKPGTIIALDAMEAPSGRNAHQKLGLLCVHGAVNDPEIAGFIRDAPAIFRDPLFGEFHADPRLPTDYAGRGEWNGVEIDITLVAEDAEPVDLIPPLMRVWEERSAWEVRLREAIAERYYPLWLDVWREDAPFLDREAFKARFLVESLSIHSSGDFDLMFADNNLFLGHSMLVSVSENARRIDVSMCG